MHNFHWLWEEWELWSCELSVAVASCSCELQAVSCQLQFAIECCSLEFVGYL